MKRLLLILSILTGLTAPSVTAEPLRILVMGDSFMTSNTSQDAAVPQVLARDMGAKVKSTAVSGARFGYKLPLTGALGLNIAKQYRKGNWDTIVMNGGGNDLWLGCGCLRCANRLARLISPDGSKGRIPQAVARAARRSFTSATCAVRGSIP